MLGCCNANFRTLAMEQHTHVNVQMLQAVLDENYKAEVETINLITHAN